MVVVMERLQYRELWNSEYPLFVEQVVEISGKYNPESLHLKKPYEKVKGLLPGLSGIKAQELSTVKSNELKMLDDERDVLLDSIRKGVRNFGKTSIPLLSPHVIVMKRLLDKHGRDIADDNYIAKTKRISDLLNDWNEKDDVKAAVIALSMLILFDQLLLVNTQFADLYLQRTGDNSVQKVNTMELRSVSDKVLMGFMDAIEYCSSEYEELDYQGLANELNELIVHYRSALKSRATRRNSGKDTSTEAPINRD